MASTRQAPAWFLWTLAGAVCLADWLSKRWVLAAFTEGHTREILGEFLRLHLVRNTGVAFGLFSGGGLQLSWVSLLALVAVLWVAFRPAARRWTHAVSLGLILGGALGNLLDRLRYGSVTDFIDVGIGSLRWWVFNVADAAITVGVLLWAAEILFARRQTAAAPAAGESAALESAGPESAASPGAVASPGAATAPRDDARGA